jgi:DNA (cytosine-5)-methyltransferase 1
MHLFPYKWFLRNGYPAENIKPNNLNVFGTFICGGGSTMGYKLAGFNHLGGVEIDPQVAAIYKANHNPLYLYNEDIRQFNERNDLPAELYNLDILDGSPPCSTFSMAGSREKAWGKEKHFREGQAKQVLDDLVFVYSDTIKKLMPKVAILENVKGIIQGNAKAYSIAIKQKIESFGYNVQIFLLNAASMGVPQKRERVFFVARRKDLNLPNLKLDFNEKPIPFELIKDKTDVVENMTDLYSSYWEKAKQGEALGKSFLDYRLNDLDVCYTIKASCKFSCSTIKRWINDFEAKQIGSYPLDYNFQNIEPKYLIGMSVPPVMTAQIANQIKIQWFS